MPPQVLHHFFAFLKLKPMAASFPWEADYDQLPSVSLKVQKALEDVALKVRILGACLACSCWRCIAGIAAT